MGFRFSVDGCLCSLVSGASGFLLAYITRLMRVLGVRAFRAWGFQPYRVSGSWLWGCRALGVQDTMCVIPSGRLDW